MRPREIEAERVTQLYRAGERISIQDDSLKPQYVAQHNAAFEWV